MCTLLALDCTNPLYQLRLNDACRRAKKAFYAGGSYGLLGFVFADLIEHEYLAQYVMEPFLSCGLFSGFTGIATLPMLVPQRQSNNR
jgi:hypothetical protein